MADPIIKIVSNPSTLAEEAAKRFAVAATAAGGKFSVALSGGSTPQALYQLLAAEPFRSQVDWTKVHIYFGDERCVPPDHPDSNYRMARLAMLDALPIARDNIHRMKGEDPPHAAAIEYGKLLKDKFGDGGCDLTLLGMGDDGHTASLFPGTVALDETEHRCVANYVEKLNAWRITMSAPFLNRSKAVLILTAGSGKARRIHEVLSGPHEPHRLPIQLIAPTSGQLTWLLDTAAAAMI